MNNEKCAVVIGLGGIGQAVVKALLQSGEYATVYGVSRQSKVEVLEEHACFNHIAVREYSEEHIRAACSLMPAGKVMQVICCVGVLHDEKCGVFPEKKLEDLSSEQLAYYFHENVTVPALWLKHLPALMSRRDETQVVFLSARVGSISDNDLGGWYGYRSAKAALNMLIKTAQVELNRRLKQCALVLYHPGTVDTRLSVPFQANVPAKRLFTPEFTASQLIDLLQRCNVEGAPHYIDWKGDVIPW